MTESDVQGWFDMAGDYLRLKNLRYIDPGRDFDLDESAFYLSPKGERVIVKKKETGLFIFSPKPTRKNPSHFSLI